MKKRLSGRLIGLFTASVFCTIAIHAQDQKGDWAMTGSDAGQSGWQKDELGLAPDTIAAKFKYLWKIKLGQPTQDARSFSEPLLIGRVINGQGFKDIVFMTSGDTLYAVDSELGEQIWKKKFDVGNAPQGCQASRLGMLMEPPVVINFRARRKRPAGTPAPPEPPPVENKERRLGAAPGGGYFGFKGIYVLTPDGMLHEQIVTTGADFASPVKFLPSANGSADGLNVEEKTIYTATGRDCGEVPNGMWAVSLTSGDYPVKNYSTGKIHPLSITGPVITPEGTSILVTGPGPEGSTETHPNSVIAIGKDFQVKDWYTPEGGLSNYENVSPVAFSYKTRELVVAPGKDGRFALLDAASLGGADHHTPVFETAEIFKPGEKHTWDGFASWADKDGTTWVYASVSTEVSLSDSGIKLNGPTTHGAIVAFKVIDSEGKLSLRPVWVSQDMLNPAPPRIANGVVIALAGGDSTTHAVLHVLDATSGAGLYSSKNEISTYTHLSGVSVGDSHAFFTDHDNVLYSFGIALEH